MSQPPTEANATAGRRTSWVLRVAFAIVLSTAAIAVVLGPTGQWISSGLSWIDGLGAWGGVVFVLGYVAATVLFIPGSLLTVGAGFLFGPIWGTVAVSVGSTLGALCAFGIGRYLAGDWVRERVTQSPRLLAVIRAVESDALKVVLLLRLVPLFPFNLLNYSLGITEITWKRFVLASWLGMLPGTFAYVMIGAAAGSLTRALSGDGTPDSIRLAIWGVGAAALVLVTWFLARRARRELDALTDVPESNPD